MSFQTPITIANVIEDIERKRFLLPAIQREFVWGSEKIEWLFDSLMREYPVSSFLFWNVEEKIKESYKFYSFIDEYREKYKTHNDVFDTSGVQNFIAVLDGQQRLTSIYIGLKGSYAYKLPRVWWENTEKNIPTRRLYLDIDKALVDQEDGRLYNFKFLTQEEYDANPSQWFKVGKILDLKNHFEFNKFLDSNGLKQNEFSYETLARLHQAIHTDRIINYFLEKEQDIDKALNIFIRINSGGEPLNFSDLLMSIAVANWKKKDAKAEIFKLVDEIRDKGFFITKDFILKAFLVLHSTNIKFKVTNFSADNAKDFEHKWETISNVIHEVFDLIKRFGYVESTLTSKNALMPIIYYIYHRDIYKDFSTKKQYEGDRKIIAKWLHIVLLNRIFGGQTDTMLVSIRSVFTDDISKEFIKPTIETFPFESIYEKLKGTNKQMGFDDELINKILLTQKDDNYAFSILALLYDNFEYENKSFHKDHMHPASHFNKKKLNELNIPKDDLEFYLNTEHYNSILNLQILDENENESKKDKSLDEWVDAVSKRYNMSKIEFCEKNMIPEQTSIYDFKKFIESRKEVLKEKMSKIIQKSPQ